MKILVLARELPVPSALGVTMAVASTWAERGHVVSVLQDGSSLADDADALVIEGNLNWFPKTVRSLRGMSRGRRPLVVLWHREPLPPSRASGLPRPRRSLREWAKVVLRDARTTDVHSNARRIVAEYRAGTVDVVMAATRGRVEFLTEQGVPAEWVPIAYEPALGRPLDLERDIDVLFLGALEVPRRRAILRRFARSGLAVRASGSWFDPSLWGESRTRLLNRTKILLNLARTAGELSDHRLLLGLANKALVVSEPIHRPDPFRPGEHFVMSPIEEIPETVRRYLQDDVARSRIVDEGHRFVTEEHTLDRSAARILEVIDAATCAGASTLSRP